MTSQVQGFWGLQIQPQKIYNQVVTAPFRIAMAALTEKQTDNLRTSVSVKVDDKEFILCSLTPGNIEQQPLDITFVEGENVSFSVKGKNAVHLTGNYVFDDEDSEDESMDEAEEAQAGLIDAEVSDEDDDDDDEDEEEEEDEDDEEEESEEEEDEEEEESEEEPVKPASSKNDMKRNAAAPAQQPKAKKHKADAAEAAELKKKELVQKQLEELELKQQQKKEKKKQSQEEHKKKLEEQKKKFEEIKQKKAELKKQQELEQKKLEQQKKAEEQKKLEEQKKAEEKKKQEEKSKVKKLPNGLIIEDVKIGNGAVAKSGNRVGMRYVGKLTNGKVFDKNVSGKPFTFLLGRGEVIKGWDIGVAGMKIGGERKLTIPAPLAYGKRGAPPDIPPNATLVFEVKLMSVK